MPRIMRPLLLFFHQDFKSRSLVWRQDREEFIFGLLQFGPQLWRNRFHEFACTFLARLKELVNALALVRVEAQVAFRSPEKLEPQTARRISRRQSRRTRDARANRGRSLCRMPDHQTARHHTGDENNHRGKNDLPGVHQTESFDCAWSTAARTVFSNS